MAKGFFGSPGAARRRARKAAAVVEVRRKKEFTYRGKTIEELKALPFEEVIELLPSRARRVFRRGLSPEQHKLMKSVEAAGETAGTFRTHRRDMPILPLFVGHTFAVHSGKEFRNVHVVPEMIGHYLGEFVLTRKAVKHGGVGVGATRASKYMPLK